jgi:hypothetical protein
MDDFDAARELDLRRAEARRAVDEAGGGESEGFELAEEELIEHTSHGDEHASTRIIQDSAEDVENGDATYGEADEELKPD